MVLLKCEIQCCLAVLRHVGSLSENASGIEAEAQSTSGAVSNMGAYSIDSNVSLVYQQEPHALLSSMKGGHVQGCVAPLQTGENQQGDETDCPHVWHECFHTSHLVSEVRVGLGFEQQLHNSVMTIVCSPVQWCPVVLE